MSDRSVHDNNIYAYAVLCERRRLILYTQFMDGAKQEYTDVIFDGVVAHHFQDVPAGNILFQVEEVDVEDIVRGWSDLFADRKNYGWPNDIDYDGTEQLLTTLRQRGARGFEISSSYGLHGWVLARSKVLRVRDGKAGLNEEGRE